MMSDRARGTAQATGTGTETMRARTAMAAALLAAAVMGWSASADAAEARIEGFEFACTTPEGETLKPKFGDIGGVFYTDLPAQREQCLQAIRQKIALCRENVDFESNTKNETHAPCLPIFAQQAGTCIGHFTFEEGKCDAGGPGPDEAARGEAAQPAEEAEPEDDYTVAPLDAAMEVAARANVRSGPGTGYAVLGTLDAGAGVRVTGAVEGGDWLRVDLREDGGAAFIHSSLLKEMAPEAPPEPFGSDWAIVENQPCQVWFRSVVSTDAEPEDYDSFTWSGACVDGKASGEGRLTWRMKGVGDGAYDGSTQAGKMQGFGTLNYPRGSRYEGGFADGRWYGRGTFTTPDGGYFNCVWQDEMDVDTCI